MTFDEYWEGVNGFYGTLNKAAGLLHLMTGVSMASSGTGITVKPSLSLKNARADTYSNFKNTIKWRTGKGANNDLLDDGWKLLKNKSKGGVKSYQKTIDGEKHYLRYNPRGVQHSKNGRVVEYWKLGKGKNFRKAMKDENVIFRSSKNKNFKE